MEFKVFTEGQLVTFEDEPDTPYNVRAVGEFFVVLTRIATEEDLESFEIVELTERDIVVYTIIDKEKRVRGPDHWVFGKYNYNSDEGCIEALNECESGVCEISRRNSCAYRIICVK